MTTALPRPAITQDVCRGVTRALFAAGQSALAEVPLGNGRRADLVAIARAGEITIVEVKSGRADFQADRKWQDYLPFCDLFFFAVGPGFPDDLLPAGEGLIRADRYGAEVARPALRRPLSGARRKAMLIRLARAAAARVYLLTDPDAGPDGFA